MHHRTHSTSHSPRHSDLERAGDLLRFQHPHLVISKRKLREADAIQMVRRNRESEAQNLGFSSRPFVLCGLPVKRPPRGCLLHERRNGRFVLQVTGHPSYGPGDRIDWFRSFWPQWQCGSNRLGSRSTAPPKCSIHLVFSRAAPHTDDWLLRSSASSAPRSFSAPTLRETGQPWSMASASTS